MRKILLFCTEMLPVEVTSTGLGGKMSKTNQEMKLETVDFVTGEQEAVARAAHEASKIPLALRNAERRYRMVCAGTIMMQLVWLAFVVVCLEPIVDLIMNWTTFGFVVHISGQLYFPGSSSGLIVGMVFVFYSLLQRCGRRFGRHFQVGRLILPARLITVLGLMAGAWLMALVACRHTQMVAYGVTWKDIAFVANMTGYIVTLLGYWLTNAVIGVFLTSRQQLIREEFYAMGIFD